jgi:hypothetical protein
LRILLLSLAFYAVLAFPINYAHEAGHHWVCVAGAHESQIWLSVEGGHQTCSGNPENVMLYYASGGMMGLAVALALTVTSLRLSPRRYGAGLIPAAMLLTGLTYSVDNFAKIFLEVFVTGIYHSSLGAVLMAPFQIGILFAIWLNLHKIGSVTISMSYFSNRTAEYNSAG